MPFGSFTAANIPEILVLTCLKALIVSPFLGSNERISDGERLLSAGRSLGRVFGAELSDSNAIFTGVNLYPLCYFIIFYYLCQICSFWLLGWDELKCGGEKNI